MNKSERLLVSLSPARLEWYTPVQVQKLMFLNEKIPGNRFPGDGFSFQPYDYGPFDPKIYAELGALEGFGFIEIRPSGKGWSKYRLTEAGVDRAEELSNTLETEIVEYLSKTSEFVRKLSFTDLVSSIYKAFPEMKINSVFKE